jgi:hypothetical protein
MFELNGYDAATDEFVKQNQHVPEASGTWTTESDTTKIHV